MRNFQNKHNQLYALTFLFLHLFDFSLSFFLLNEYGFEYEMNPLIRNNYLLILALFVGTLLVPILYKYACNLSKDEKQLCFVNDLMLILLFMKVLIVVNNFVLMAQ